jgi:hypothetical protein
MNEVEDGAFACPVCGHPMSVPGHCSMLCLEESLSFGKTL